MTTTLAAPAAQDSKRAYASAAQIPLRRLIGAEWHKSIDTRGSRWLLVLIGISSVALMLAPLIATKSFDQNVGTYLGFAGFAVSLMLPISAVMLLTRDWSQRTVLTTFTAEPRRERVINAKLAVAGLYTLLGIALAVLCAGAGLIVALLIGRDLDWSLGPAALLGFVLGIALNVAMGVAYGAVLQNTSAAIVALFLVPAAFGLLSGPLGHVADWISPARALDWVANANFDGHVLKIVVSLLLWIAVPLVVGLRRTARREVV